MLDVPIYLPAIFKGANPFQKLNGPLEHTEELQLDWSGDIPNSLKLKLYIKFGLQLKSHLYDIDHVVPRSLGGPGNIEENLYPLPSSINRKKSDAVPAGIFVVAAGNKDLADKASQITQKYIKRQLSYSPEDFIGNEDAKLAAKEIVAFYKILGMIAQTKSFFNSVKLFHFPDF